MRHLEQEFEQVFVDVAMAEERNFPTLAEELHDAAETFECTFVDVALAEAGEFTESSCHPAHR